MWGRSPHRSRVDQHGVGTICAVWAMVLVAAVALLGLVAAMATARQHRVDASADLAAVSAADSLQRGGAACSAAARVVTANGVRMADCRVDGADVIVIVDDRLHLPLGLEAHLVASARAGPPAQ